MSSDKMSIYNINSEQLMNELVENLIQLEPKEIINRDRIKTTLSRMERVVEEVIVDKKLVKNPFNVLWEKKSSKYQKVSAALSIISIITPETIKKNYRKNFIYFQDKMPFDIKDYKLEEKIGSGGMNNVYLLKPQRNNLFSFVLKINRSFSEPKNINSLLQSAIKQKKEYQGIKTAYEKVQNLIPKEDYFLIHGPRLGKPAVALLQKYMGKNMKDIFTDYKKEDLLKLLADNSSLSQQLKDFVDATEANPNLLANELDLLGKDNLVIVGNKDEERLLFIDPHFRLADRRSQKYRLAIQERFNYLKEICRTKSI